MQRDQVAGNERVVGIVYEVICVIGEVLRKELTFRPLRLANETSHLLDLLVPPLTRNADLDRLVHFPRADNDAGNLWMCFDGFSLRGLFRRE